MVPGRALTSPTAAPRWRLIVVVGLAVAIAAFVVVREHFHAPLGAPGSDIDQAWQAARAVLRGQDAYRAVWPDQGFGFPLFYPLTTALIAIPLAPLPIEYARIVFIVGTAALLGHAVGTVRPYLWPMFLSMSFVTAATSVQWSPLLTAAMLYPALGWLGAAKPNLGIVMLAGARSLRDAKILVIGGLALVVVSLAVDPMWPWKWHDALAHSTHFKPLLLRPGGFLMLLGLLRWRDPDARLLVALALVPVNGPFYDILPAYATCRTRQQALILAVASQVGWRFGPMLSSGPDWDTLVWVNGSVVLWFGLLPALAIVLFGERSSPEES